MKKTTALLILYLQQLLLEIFPFTITILSKFYTKKKKKKKRERVIKMSIKSNHYYNIHLDRNNKDPIQLVPSYFPTRQVKKVCQSFLKVEE